MRQLIREFVEIVAKTLPIGEPILEFGALQVEGQEDFANLRPFFEGKEYVGCDMRAGLGVDRVLDCHNIDLPAESAGSVLAMDTLEHVEHCRKAVSEFDRILEPGGILVISSVMNYKIHDYPYDYWRFTPHAFRSLLKDFPYSFVEAVGEEAFPHTVVGIACKGDIPEEPLSEFMKGLRDWKKAWDTARSGEESTRLHSYYNCPRPEVTMLVPAKARRVLDVGCAAGMMGEALKARGVETVVGVELNPEVAEMAAKRLDRVLVGDIEEMELPYPEGHFDCLVMADVLEHLRDPWGTVKKLSKYLSEAGTVVCSIPNIRNLAIINSLIQGNWTYTSAGILDRTHLRFFTFNEFRKLLSEAGFSVNSLVHVKDPHLSLGEGAKLDGSPINLNYGDLTIRDLHPRAIEELTTYQFLVVGTKAEVAPAKAPEMPLLEITSNRTGKTSIVILTLNQLEYTRLCVESIRKYTAEPYELVFVDNGSDDGTLEYLRSIPDVKVISNGTNLGFALGCNQGIAASSGDYIMLLNNDVVVTEGWLMRMLHCAETVDGVGLVGPMSNYVIGPQLVADVPYGDDVEQMQDFAREFAARPDKKNFLVYRAIGFCLLIKRCVIDKIGGLDPRFATGNFEDDDFCIRAQLAGYRICIAGDAFIHHFGNRTFVGSQIDYRNSITSNWSKFAAKWGLPESTGPKISYLPHELVSSRTFEPALHYVPLSCQAGASPCLAELLTDAAASEVSGDTASAFRLYKAALKLGPQNGDILFDLGRISLSLGNMMEAIHYLEQAVAQIQDNDLIHAYLGMARFRTGDLLKAEECLKKSLTLNPQLEPAQRGLVDVLMAQGRFAEATELLRRIVAGPQACVDDLVMLSDCYRQSGALDAARIGYEAVTQMAPGHEQARAGLEALAVTMKEVEHAEV